ncbi:MAG: hypothetical protein RSE00_00250 [Clostridia bacterium]
MSLYEDRNKLESEIATLEKVRKDYANLLENMLSDMNTKLKRIEDRARSERGINFEYTNEEKEMIKNIQAEYADKKAEVIDRAKKVVDDIDTKNSWLENNENSIKFEEANAQKENLSKDLYLIRNEMEKSFEDFKWDGATLKNGAVSTTLKTYNELLTEYQALRAKVDKMHEDGKIDMRKVSELKRALLNTFEEYSKKAPQKTPDKRGDPGAEETDFNKKLRQQVNNINDQVNNMSEKEKKEIEKGQFDDKEDKKSAQVHKVEKTDDDFVM